MEKDLKRCNLTMNKELKRYFFLTNTMFVALDIWAYDNKDVRRRIREFLGRKNRLPNGTQIWKA